MVLLDGDYMCALCTERFDSEQEWLFHLSATHMYFRQQAAPTTQHAAPTTSYGNNTNTSSTPYRQMQSRPGATTAPRQNPNTYSSPMPPPAVPAQLLTPPRSTGTPSPHAIPRSVPQPGQNYGSPYAVTGQVPLYSSPQQNGNQQVFGNMLPRNMSNAAPNKLPPQPLQRQFVARDTPVPTYSSIPASPTPTATAKLPPGLPPLPRAIYDLGLSDIDFDPTADHGRLLSTEGRYIDIPSSINVPDQHMFNANCNTLLNFGNLLRLASRYTHTELMRNLNSMRKGAAFRFKSAQITKRLKVAVGWAARRPEWQEVGDVQVWLDGKRDARGLQLTPQHGKRKREDVTDAGVTNDKVEVIDVESLGTPRSQLPTPPPTKRIKATATPTPARGHYAQQADIVDLTNEIGSENAMALVNALSMESINGAGSVEVGMESDAPSSREMEPGEKYDDIVDLTNELGSENAMALVNALSMEPINGAASGEVEMGSDAPSSREIGPGENSDDIFAEFLAHPENFMSPMELRVGQWLQHACDVMRARQEMKK